MIDILAGQIIGWERVQLDSIIANYNTDHKL